MPLTPSISVAIPLAVLKLKENPVKGPLAPTSLRSLIVNPIINAPGIVIPLFISLKDEINKDENMDTINNDIIKPIVLKIINEIYPYFFTGCLIFLTMFIFIILILLLNLKIYYK